MPPRRASSFRTLAERRDFLASAPDTHANHRGDNWPAGKWLRLTKDTKRLVALRIWRDMNEPAQVCANDNNPTWPDGRPMVTQLNVEMESYDAEQLIYAYEHGMVRMVGNKLVKVWNGFRWVNPDEDFTSVKVANDPKVDATHFHADVVPTEAQEEVARVLDAKTIRASLGAKTCAILDLAAGDSTIREIGEALGFSGKYAERKGADAVRAAIDEACTRICTSVP